MRRVLLILLLSLSQSFIRAAAQEKSNIVVVMTDDQPDIETRKLMPKLANKIAKYGVTFTRAFVSFPLCTPSRTSFLTGLAAHNHGVVGNTPETQGGYETFRELGLEDQTLAVWLQAAGYRTIFVGKYLNGDVSEPTRVPPGWDKWIQKIGRPYYNYEINQDGVLRFYGKSSKDYITDVFAGKITSFIRQQTKPFFALVMVDPPHIGKESYKGYNIAKPPVRYDGIYNNRSMSRSPNFNEADVSDKPGYVQDTPLMDAAAIEKAMVKYRRAKEALRAVDDLIGRIVILLSRLGKLDNTYIIFTSDHGQMYGRHRLTGKQVPYEESIRVPLLIRGPGIPHREKRDAIVSNLDVVATIVEIASATPTHPLDGRSLLPLLADKDIPWRGGTLVQGSFSTPITNDLGRYFALRTKSYSYVEDNSTYYGREQELYDLAVDPYQLENRAGDPSYASVVGELSSILSEEKTCAGDNCWVNEDRVGTLRPTGSEGPRRTTVYASPLRKDRTRAMYDAQQDANE